MKHWAYLKQDGGHFILSWLADSVIDDFLGDPDEYDGIERFLGEEHLSEAAMKSGWQYSDAMLLKVEVVVPKEKTKAWKLEE